MYYAKELRGDYFDWELYISEEELADRNIAICGNREFKGINTEMISEILTGLEQIQADYDYDLGDFEDEETARKEIIDNISDYFVPSNRSDFTEEEKNKLLDLGMQYCTAYGDDVGKIIVQALGIVYGMPFTCGIIRGCCQGDWNGYYAPEGTDMSYIEAVYFGTGTEYLVSKSELESADELDFDTGITYYTAEYSAEKIKEDLAIQADIDKNNLIVLNIKAEHHHTTYDYEEI